MLIISGPSLILAFIKLRKRNLGPILDANGWAVNAKASINVPFGTSLTGIAKLPKGSSVDISDRYAQKSAMWPKVLIVLFFVWWIFAFAYDMGITYRLTEAWKWKTPLGKPPAALKEKSEELKPGLSAAEGCHKTCRERSKINGNFLLVRQQFRLSKNIRALFPGLGQHPATYVFAAKIARQRRHVL